MNTQLTSEATSFREIRLHSFVLTTNFNGVFTIDYIRFIRNENTMKISDAELATKYTSRTIFDDITFENGFYLKKPDDDRTVVGTWNYNNSTKEPIYNLCPWWTESEFVVKPDDKYTLIDGNGSKIVKISRLSAMIKNKE